MSIRPQGSDDSPFVVLALSCALSRPVRRYVSSPTSFTQRKRLITLQGERKWLPEHIETSDLAATKQLDKHENGQPGASISSST